MNRPAIYLCDLIHNYVCPKEMFYVVPLNIGFIGAYLKGVLGEAVEIRMFKYPDRLVEALKTDMPNIIGFSYYIWNEELVVYLARKIKEVNPDVLVVLGGPNVDTNPSHLTRFFKTHPYIDYYIPFEGEEVFARLVEAYMDIGNVPRMKHAEIRGTATYMDGLNYPVEEAARGRYIDYPSPYLTGIMDEFIKDPYLHPLFETNRGCPFSCTYCAWGCSARNRMRMWPLEQIFDEFEYVTKHGVNQEKWIFADSNFGIFERDIEIAKRIYSISRRPGGVKSILACSSKNTTQRNSTIAEILSDLTGYLVAFQTLDKEVLSNIKRDNIPESSFVPLLDYFKSKGARIETDILIGLSGETYKSHLNTLRRCFDYDIRYVRGMNIRLLVGTEMASEESKARFGTKAKYRLIKDSYGYYWDGWVIDCEEVVCATDAMSEGEMLKLRLIHYFIWLFWNQGFLQPLMLAGRACGINPIDQILELVDAGEAVSPEYACVISDYMKEAAEEWFETKADLMEHYSQSKNIEELLQEFNFLNFKYSPRIIFGRDVLSGIADFLEDYYMASSPFQAEECNLKEVKDFSIQRLCLDLDQIDESRTLTLSKNTCEFLAKEDVIPETVYSEGTAENDHFSIRVQLKDRDFLMNELEDSEGGIEDVYSGNIITAKFLQSLVYTA